MPLSTPSAAPSAPVAPAARFFALIPCAGAGSRAGLQVAGSVKQYHRLAGAPMVAHTLGAFRGLAALGLKLDGLWLLVSPDDALVATALPNFPNGLLESGRADEAGPEPLSTRQMLPLEHLSRSGGATRAETVRNGLRALRDSGAAAHDWVLVHDAARCLIRPAQIAALIVACRDDPVGGLLAHKLPDTLKAATVDGRAAATLPRDDKWLAQTPQMFRLGVLLQALEQGLRDSPAAVTDEASAIEALGHAPLLVPGSAQNFKVTYPEDFALAEAVLRARVPFTDNQTP